jgi:hypothetical protein
MSSSCQAGKAAIVEHVYKLMQEISEAMGGRTTFFFVKALRAPEWIGYDAGLFGRDDKRRKTSQQRFAGA